MQQLRRMLEHLVGMQADAQLTMLDDVLAMVQQLPSAPAASQAQSSAQQIESKWPASQPQPESPQIETKWPVIEQTDASAASASVTLEHKRAAPASLDAAIDDRDSPTWRAETKAGLRDLLQRQPADGAGAASVDALVEWLLQRFGPKAALPASAIASAK